MPRSPSALPGIAFSTRQLSDHDRLHEIRSRTSFHGRRWADPGSPANPVKTWRAGLARVGRRELSLDRVCELVEAAASPARIRLV